MKDYNITCTTEENSGNYTKQFRFSVHDVICSIELKR